MESSKGHNLQNLQSSASRNHIHSGHTKEVIRLEFGEFRGWVIFRLILSSIYFGASIPAKVHL